jgi:hypothetical protein
MVMMWAVGRPCSELYNISIAMQDIRGKIRITFGNEGFGLPAFTLAVTLP